MSRKTKTIQIFLTISIVLLVLVGLGGCTTNQNEIKNTNETVNAFLGTWAGTLEIPMVGGSGNTSASQITFTSNRAEMMLTTGNRTFAMNYMYTTNGNSLILTPTMTDRNGFPGGQPFNGTIPPNGTQPPGNRTWPPNGTNPYNGTWPSNRTQPPGGNRPSMTISLTYAFDEEKTMLTLNGAKFIKTQ